MAQSRLSSSALSASLRDVDGQPSAVARGLILLLRGYRLSMRGVLPQACRFSPTCSVFAEEAIRRHGAARGAILGIRRLLRCHPWHAGGYDPVPARFEG